MAAPLQDELVLWKLENDGICGQINSENRTKTAQVSHNHNFGKTEAINPNSLQLQTTERQNSTKPSYNCHIN